MKAVILAGGNGTRLRPLTRLLNKHLLPVGSHPMITYGIRKLRDAGMKDLLLITGREPAGDFIRYYGSGSDEGVSITYRIQERAGGIAQALRLAETFIARDERFLLLLGDNLFEEELTPFVADYVSGPPGAYVLLKKVPDPQRYGVPVFDASGRIVSIDEKPRLPQSDYCVTGIYMYDGGVFDIARRIVPSKRGELEITDVNNAYAAEGRLRHGVLAGWWADAGTFDSLREASERMKDKER